MSKVKEIKLAGKYEGFENRVIEHIVTLPDLRPVTITGKFFYLSFRGQEPTVEEFVDYLYYRMVPFCIPRTKRYLNYKKFETTGDDRYYVELLDQAKNLFVKALNSDRSGEPGELILFSFIEAFLNAPQIACKMYLKTSEKMNVHGSDSIHAMYNSGNGELNLIWGESKLYKSISASIEEICESISSFYYKKDERTPRERDIDIIKDHPNIDDPEMKDAFLKYFDPYTSEVNKRVESFCCLSGFDCNIYNKLEKISDDKIEEYFKKQYMGLIIDACILFKEKIIKHNIDKLNYIFMLLPFKSVVEFRKLFFKKLGYSKR